MSEEKKPTQSGAQTKDEHKQEKPKELSELELTKKKMEEYLDGWKRAKADYINFKKETEKQQQEIMQFANATLILELLPIYDNFKLAWQHIPEDKSAQDGSDSGGKENSDWLKGIEQIKKQFGDMLRKLGIEEIKTVGEKFDPELHESVAKEKVEGTKPDIITEEVKGGYKLYDRVLEHAKVKVAE